LDDQAGQIAGIDSYAKGIQQSVLSLYEPILRKGDTKEDYQAWWDWLRQKFPAYDLGELPTFEQQYTQAFRDALPSGAIP
jgi:hypothetical protein